MKKHSNKVWIGTDELEATPEYLAATDQEQAGPSVEEDSRLSSSRRDFLKYLGFGMTAATIASCDIPVRKAIPYVSKPDTIVPGVASYFASTFVQGGDYVPVLVKTREGRPIKVEGNSMSPITGGGTSARVQASVLTMYDTSRYDGPYRIDGGLAMRERVYGNQDGWDAIDREIIGKLKPNSQVRIVGHTTLSPSLKLSIKEFRAKYPNTAFVQYDPVSSAALLDANESSFGVRAVPSYHFDKADVIVSFGADFLGTWISPVQYAKDYIKGRSTEGTRMNRHIQVESHMSLTGSNADNRILVKPSQQGAAIAALYAALSGGNAGGGLSEEISSKIGAVARELRNASGRALVISNSNNLSEQLLVNAINNALGSYGSTITTDRWSFQRQGSDRDLATLAAELRAGTVDALIVLDGANPAWDNVYADSIRASLLRNGGGSTTEQGDTELLQRSEQVEAKLENGSYVMIREGATRAATGPMLTISTSGVPNETTQLCQYVTPTHHYLESWGDAEAVQGHYSLIQPAMVPIFASVGRHGTRAEGETLLTWAGSSRLDPEADQPYLDFVMKNWEDKVFGGQSQFSSFRAFWDSALHDGVFETAGSGGMNDYGIGYAATTAGATAEVAEEIAAQADPEVAGETPFVNSRSYRNTGVSGAVSGITTPAAEGGKELTIYETINIGNGVYAGNPWLQECPDPVARTTWGNYLSIPVWYEDGENSYTAYQGMNSEEYKGKADKATVSKGEADFTVTTVRQFGQLKDTFGLAIGYGRTITGMSGRALGNEIGVNVYPWLTTDENGYVQYYVTGVEVSGRVETEEEFASVQYHHTMGLTKRDDSGAMIYYNTRTGDTENIAGELTAEQAEYLQPFNVDEKTVMELGEGMQGGLVDRSIIYQGTFNELGELKEHIGEKRHEAQHLNDQTLYPYDEYVEEIYSQGHWWAMHVDLTKCIGCAACEVACVAENNVPVVGKYEVWRHHEMKWLRIDRYFYGDVENPRAVYQPMMCQHCDNAPCENVCPVNASQHSDEGLNQMIYNRCIGTRYCANNCPYKVRRFNWLDFTTGDLFSSNEPEINGEELAFGADNLTRMVLNPDVTVRSRGVIEKCSFCAQRLQSGKLTAKIEGRKLRDSDVRTACQTACPTGAITFGDRNNKQGDVAGKLVNPLNYLALEEVNTQSAVFYAARVHNPLEELDA